MRLRRETKLSISSLPFAARTRHAWLARQARARGKSFLRGRKALLNDFCRAFGHSKAREEKSYFMFLLFQSSFRLSEKNEKDKKRNALTPVSATPTHMLRICVNPSFNLFLSPRGDRCEHTSPTVRQLLNHGYRFETLKRRLGFTAVPCRAMANLAVRIWVRVYVRT